MKKIILLLVVVLMSGCAKELSCPAYNDSTKKNLDKYYKPIKK